LYKIFKRQSYCVGIKVRTRKSKQKITAFAFSFFPFEKSHLGDSGMKTRNTAYGNPIIADTNCKYIKKFEKIFGGTERH